MLYNDDIQIAKNLFVNLPTAWDGKTSILEMKDANFNWRQMEWWAFYFELLCQRQLKDDFIIPGDHYGSTATSHFDLKRGINWDLKAKAIKSDDHFSILNDMAAMDASIQAYGAHGLMIGLCDVEYNDNNRTFQRWHEDLKGGKSKYQQAREQRTSLSRYRKTRAELQEVLFLIITPENRSHLAIHHQGRNSNGKPRRPKYMLNYSEKILSKFLVDNLSFSTDTPPPSETPYAP